MMLTMAFALLTFAALLLCTLIYVGTSAIVAQRFGVSVVEIGLGIGPAIWQRQVGTVLWRINLFVPLGGYAKFPDGTTPPMRDDAEPDLGDAQRIEPMAPGSYGALSIPKKMLIVLSGPLSSICLGVALLLIPIATSQPQLAITPAEGRTIDGTRAVISTATSSWPGQVQYVADSGADYLWRLITFQSLEDRGGPIKFTVTSGRIGSQAPSLWLSSVGMLAFLLGCWNLLPFPPFNGWILLTIPFRKGQIAGEGPLLLAGLLFSLICLGRALWLDVRWLL